MTTYAEFESQSRAQGADEVLERHWPANTVLDSHTHPFSVKSMVVQGEMWLTIADQVRHLRQGDRFELDRDVPHAERYGAEGATSWVARRHGSSAPQLES